jgi:hypothetical protein
MALEIKGAYRDMPQEARIECPHCGNSYHHQGAPGHIKWCEVRSPEERAARAQKTKALKEVGHVMFPIRAQAAALVNAEGERVGFRFSVSKNILRDIAGKMKVHINE